MSTPADRYFRKAEAGVYEKLMLASPEVLTMVRNKWERKREKYEEATARIREAVQRYGIDTTAGKSLLISAAYKLIKVANTRIVSEKEIQKEIEKVIAVCMYHGNDGDGCIGFVATLLNRPVEDMKKIVKTEDIKKIIDEIKKES